MGWKGTLRSVNAAVNRMEREANRRQREHSRQQKIQNKINELEHAAYEVEMFNNYIKQIKTIHTQRSPVIDWTRAARQPEPMKPIRLDTKEVAARRKLEKFKPSMFQKLFGRSEKAQKELQDKVISAKCADDETHKDAIREYQLDMSSWNDECELARKVVCGDPQSYIYVLEKFGGFAEIGDLGTGLQFSVSEDSFVRVDLNIHANEIIPAESKSLLQSGKLSVKKMNKGVFNELFQDYVCSAVLRVAREIFAVLPVDKAEITAVDEVLNRSTGHLEAQPILSVLVARDTLDSLKLDAIDPSDSMSNFVCNMDFKKTSGFNVVERLSWKTEVT